MTEAQLQRLEALIANEIRGAIAALALAISEAGEKLAAMQQPEQETPMLTIDRAAAVLAAAPKPMSVRALAEAIGINPTSWHKYAGHIRRQADPRFERRYPEGWTNSSLWWRRGGSEDVWRQTLAEWKDQQRKAFRAGAGETQRQEAAARLSSLTAAAERILSQSSRPLSTRELAEKLGAPKQVLNRRAMDILRAGRIERRYPPGMSRYSRWWTAGQPEDAWEAALSRASAECRAGLARGLQGRKGNDGWPERDPPEVIAERHARWEREKPFAADTLVFKRGPVIDYTRVQTQTLYGSSAAMLEAA